MPAVWATIRSHAEHSSYTMALFLTIWVILFLITLGMAILFEMTSDLSDLAIELGQSRLRELKDRG